MAKNTITVKTPFGTFTRQTNTRYTHAVVSVPVSRVTGFQDDGTPVRAYWNSAEEFKAWMDQEGYGKGGVFGRFSKDGGYVLSYHSSEAAARKAADKGNTPYVVTRTLGVFPVEA